MVQYSSHHRSRQIAVFRNFPGRFFKYTGKRLVFSFHESFVSDFQSGKKAAKSYTFAVKKRSFLRVGIFRWREGMETAPTPSPVDYRMFAPPWAFPHKTVNFTTSTTEKPEEPETCPAQQGTEDVNSSNAIAMNIFISFLLFMVSKKMKLTGPIFDFRRFFRYFSTHFLSEKKKGFCCCRSASVCSFSLHGLPATKRESPFYGEISLVTKSKTDFSFF